MQTGLKLLIWVGLLALLAFRWAQLIPLLRNPLIILTGLFILVSLCSVAWSEVPLLTAVSVLGNISYLGFAGLIAVQLKEHTTIRIMFWSLGAYIAVNALGGVIAPGLTWLAPSVEETSFRLQGFSGHPNVLAQQTGLLLIIALISYRMKLIGLFLFLGTAGLSAATILASGSRTTLAASILTIGLVYARNSRLGIPLVLATLLAGAILLAIFATGEVSILNALLQKMSRTGSIDEIMTFTGRTDLWSVAWSGIMEKPLLGWGYNGVEDYIARSVSTTFYGNAVNAHNELIHVLLSIGIIGTIPVLIWLGILILRFFTQPDPVRDLIIIFWFFMGFFELEIFTTPVLMSLLIFWIFARETTKKPKPHQSFDNDRGAPALPLERS